jgi:tetratricopeptide (TPR) repeat protein
MSAVEQARYAIQAGNIEFAFQVLEPALRATPDDPDLACEYAIACSYAQREAEAEQLFPACQGADRLEMLARILAEHAFCEDRTTDAERFRAAYGDDFRHVGTRITACLIVKNESGNLRRCLSSLEGAVDEIVVVDTGSSDDTVEIARSFGAVIGQFPWNNDFSAARNAALDLATGHWILWIDADEELTKECAAMFRRAAVRPQFGGYRVEIANFVDDRDTAGEFSHTPTRLFRNLPGVRFTGRIHEQVNPSIDALGLPIARMESARILHHGYRPNEYKGKEKGKRNIEMLEREVADHPNESFHWFNLANAYVVEGRYEDSETAARRCTALLTPDANWGKLAYQILAHSLTRQNRYAMALKACDEAEQNGFGSLFTDFERATALLALGNLKDALQAIDQCLAQEWIVGEMGDRGVGTYKREVLRAQILIGMDRYAEANLHLDRALAFDSEYGPTVITKGLVLERLGRYQEACPWLMKAAELDAERPFALPLLAHCHLQEGDARRALHLYREAWQCTPGSYDVWTGWVASAETAGDSASVLEAYSAWAEGHELTADQLINWGRALESSNDPERAMACYSEAMQRDAGSANAAFNAGDLLYRLEKYVDAAHLYERALRLDPGNVQGWFVMGNTLAQLNLSAEAEGCYRRVLEADPEHTSAKYNLAVIQRAA